RAGTQLKPCAGQAPAKRTMPLTRTAPGMDLPASPTPRTPHPVPRTPYREPIAAGVWPRGTAALGSQSSSQLILLARGPYHPAMSNHARLTGIFTPNLVPYTPDGSINEPELRRYVDWLIERGVHGLYPNGSTGEFTRFTVEERRRIVEIIAD